MWWLGLVACTRGAAVVGLDGTDGSGHRLVFTGEDASVLTVSCALQGDPAEVHRAEGLGRVSIEGLLAETAYDCAFTTGAQASSITVTTGAPDPLLPTWTLDESEAGDGYTLLNVGRLDDDDRRARLIVVDREGRLRWSFDAGQGLEPDDVDANYVGDGEFVYGGGQVLLPARTDLAGNALWEGPPSSTGLGYHHVANEAPGGEVLVLTHRTMTGTDGDQWNGFEAQWIDPATNAVVQRVDSADGVAAGWLEVPSVGVGDAYHANSVTDLGDGTVLLSLLNAYQVLRLDLATGLPLWRIGPYLDDFALLDVNGDPAPDTDWFYHQHAPSLRGDELLLYDNGENPAGGSLQSRVVAFRLDEDARTLQTLWSWTEPGWYEPVWGDADWLPNGNVLVDRAHHSSASDELRTEIVELDALTHEPVWRLRMDDVLTSSYRAQRIDGCAIFANEQYCPPEP